MTNSENNQKSSMLVSLVMAAVLGILTVIGGTVYFKTSLSPDKSDPSVPEVSQADQAKTLTTITEKDESKSEEIKSDASVNPNGKDSFSNSGSSEKESTDQVIPNEVQEETVETANVESETVSASTDTDDAPALTQEAKDLQLGKTIDLLATFNPKAHETEGTWTKSAGKIVSDAKSVSTLLLPDRLPERYVMRLRARLVEGNDTLFVRTRMQDHQTNIVLNGYSGTLGGIELLDKRLSSDAKNESQFRKPMVGKESSSEIVIVSNKNSIKLTIDGVASIDWQGDPSRLSLYHSEPKENFGFARLTAVRASWEISHFSVTPILDPARQAVPDEKQVDNIRKELEERHSLKFRVTRNSEKQPFAQRLQALAVTETDPAARYVLLAEALEKSAEAGDVERSLQLAESLSDEFEVDTNEVQSETIETLAKSQREPQFQYQMALLSARFAWQAADEHDYIAAIEHCDLAESLSRKSRLRSFTDQVKSLADQFSSWSDQYASVVKSHEAIEDGTASAEDHLAWGNFLCLIRDHWDEGLPHLKQGSDPNLARLAELELNNPREFDEITDLVQQWFALAKTKEEDSRNAIVVHARELSSRAIRFADEKQMPLLMQFARERFVVTSFLDTTDEPKGILIGGAIANPPAEATIEFWFRTTDLKGGLIHKREKEPHDCIGAMIENGLAVLYVNGSWAFEKQVSDSYVSDGLWHHLALSKVGRHLRMFVDGIPVADLDPKREFPKPNDSNWRIGNQTALDNYELAAQFSRIRISSISRYHARFVPEEQYEADRQTMWFVE